MPRRLLREPHVLAHELRTPLSVLAGWCSLIRDGDVHPDRNPQAWELAMAACEDAVARLNLIIAEACDEAERLRLQQPADIARMAQLLASTTAAIDHSRQVLAAVAEERRVRQGRSGLES
jgi:signal transduction histidine kinase